MYFQYIKYENKTKNNTIAFAYGYCTLFLLP